jgi:hypothetical protein
LKSAVRDNGEGREAKYPPSEWARLFTLFGWEGVVHLVSKLKVKKVGKFAALLKKQKAVGVFLEEYRKEMEKQGEAEKVKEIRAKMAQLVV